MNSRLTVDDDGRIQLPKGLRDELHLGPGDTLELESAGEQITLRPSRSVPSLGREHGVWVFRTGEPLRASFTEETLQEIREERDRHHLGMDE